MKSKVPPAPRNTRVTSEAVRAVAERRSLSAPLVITGIGPGKLVTITPSSPYYAKLDVDPAYQRGETKMVGQIVRALQSGGSILDPVTLCVRKGGDGTLWIVDGYQRVCAFQQLKVPFTAMIHESDSQDCERQFFIALNARKAVSANVMIKAWSGATSELLQKSNSDFTHPLYERINFQQGSNETRIAASSLLRGILAVLAVDRSAAMPSMLSRVDNELRDKLQRARAEHYLRLIGKVCPKGTLPAMVLRAIGKTAREHWLTEVEMPSTKIVERLHNKNWASEMLVEKYFDVLCNTVHKIWK
jgi:hypothetical protein